MKIGTLQAGHPARLPPVGAPAHEDLGGRVHLCYGRCQLFCSLRGYVAFYASITTPQFQSFMASQNPKGFSYNDKTLMRRIEMV